MPDTNLNDFLGSWSAQVEELIEPSKLVPELSCRYVGYAGSDHDNIEVTYSGDGDVMLETYNYGALFDSKYISNDSFNNGTCNILVNDMWNKKVLSSTETENYASATYTYV